MQDQDQDRFRFTDLLEKSGKVTPLRHKKPPMWDPSTRPGGIAPGLRGVFAAAHVPAISYGAKDYEAHLPEGTALVEVDANGAFVAAATSARFAHCALEPTGPTQLPESGQIAPGYYLVDVHKWQLGAPGSPLGAQRPRSSQVWVPHTVAQHLRDLTYGGSWTPGGHWPDCTVHDSWTSDPVPFYDWAAAVRDTRAAFKRCGDADAVQRIKIAYSQAVQMWSTPPDPKGTPRDKQKKKNRAWRPDWYHALRGQHAMNMWRRAYQASLAGHAPVRVYDTDRMVFEEHHLLAILRAEKSPIRLDETGIELGTFKRTRRWYAGIEDA